MSTEQASAPGSVSGYDVGQPIQRAAGGGLEKLPPELAFNDYPTENTGLFVVQDYPLLEEAAQAAAWSDGQGEIFSFKKELMYIALKAGLTACSFALVVCSMCPDHAAGG